MIFVALLWFFVALMFGGVWWIVFFVSTFIAWVSLRASAHNERTIHRTKSHRRR